jgi:hypothetical protein
MLDSETFFRKGREAAVSGIVLKRLVPGLPYGAPGQRETLGLYFPVHLNRGEPPLSAEALELINRDPNTLQVSIERELSPISFQPQFALIATSPNHDVLLDLGSRLGISPRIIDVLATRE